MENNITFQKMSISDLDSISNILETEFDDFWNYNILKSELEDSNSLYIVCKQNDKIIGFAGITIILDIAELNNIVIKKSHRGKGYSSLLLSRLIDIAYDNKCIQLNLEVANKNLIAINLYKKFNFEKVGLRKNYYNGQDAILLTKKLI